MCEVVDLGLVHALDRVYHSEGGCVQCGVHSSALPHGQSECTVPHCSDWIRVGAHASTQSNYTTANPFAQYRDKNKQGSTSKVGAPSNHDASNHDSLVHGRVRFR